MSVNEDTVARFTGMPRGDYKGAQVKRLAQDGIRGAETSYYLRDGLDRLLD